VLLSHQLGEHGLDDGERARLTVALAIAERAMNVAAAAASAGLVATNPAGSATSAALTAAEAVSCHNLVTLDGCRRTLTCAPTRRELLRRQCPA
jgi:hypothetical protein